MLLLRSSISPSSVSCFACSTALRSCKFMNVSQLTRLPSYTGPHLLFTNTFLPTRLCRNAPGTLASIIAQRTSPSMIFFGADAQGEQKKK
ncbi:Sm-f snRNP core complex protein, putative [Leishmania tarentolae]|uniref:Sm-f snRNP core complex protein, putative n=1 Tax=Leishmania tarentolae TaxID=5689 RepID=A0A640KZK5_LEITA|nr:Sm-f snRNP core complex protein, putative [Leishmania tarentolae]